MKISYIKVITFFTLFLYSPITKAEEKPCNCSNAFNDLALKLEENYIALAQIKAHKQDAAYERRKATYSKKAATVKPENCTAFLQEFLTFFDDGHLFVYENPAYTEEDKTNINNRLRYKNLTESELSKLASSVAKTQTGPDKIIGRWTDGQSEFYITKKRGKYKAYVIKSKSKNVAAGDLIAVFDNDNNGFKGIYYTYNQTPRYTEANIYKEGTLLVLTGGTYWGKMDSPYQRGVSMTDFSDIKLPKIQKLDEKNTLFSIPSYLADNDKFIKVLLDNLELLTNTTNLIIDIRGNTGGNALYFSFLDAYADKTMESSQGLILASAATQKYFERLAASAPEVFNPVVDRIKSNMGKIIDGPLYPERTFEPFESKIKNVAILTDNGCMSAAESFILHSKSASTKVKTFGSPTGGVIDYTSIHTLTIESGKQHIYFGYPTSTLHKATPQNGYNKSGITPDVEIAEHVKDKVGFIVSYYSTHNN